MPDTNTNPNSPIVTSSIPTGGGYGQVGSQTPPLSSSIPSTISSSSIAPAAPITIPPPPPVNTGAAASLSVPNPIPSTQSIVAGDTAPTGAQNQQSQLDQQLATLIGGQSSLATDQYAKEQSAGVPALTKSVNDLTTQLNGLNDQASALQNGSANAQNNEVNQVQNGTDIFRANTNRESYLRGNSLQQAGIASQALTVKSALYAAQGNLTLAKNAADQAAQVAFDAQTQQINYQQALLAAIAPQLSRDEKTQAAQMQADLADRSNQIQLQQEQAKTGQAQAITAMQNNPNDPQAQYAAQQALHIPLTDPNYLQKVTALVGQYQKDPLALQQAQLNIQKTRLDIATAAQNLNGGSQQLDMSQLSSQQQQALVTSPFAGYNSETQGLAQQLVSGNLAPSDLSKRATGTSPYNKILAAANAYSLATTGKPFDISIAQRNYEFATNTQTQNTLNYLSSLLGTNNGSGLAGGNLDQLISMSQSVLPGPPASDPINPFAAPTSSFPALNNVSLWTKLETGDPQVAAYHATLLEVSDQVAKILQGGGTGSGSSDSKLSQAQELFQQGFTPAQMAAVAGSMKTLLQNRATAIVGNNPYLSDYAQNLGINQSPQTNTQATVIPAAQIPSGYYQASDGLLYKQ